MNTLLTDLYDIAKSIIIVLVISFLIRSFLFQPFVVEGHSMDPNFFDKEYLLVNKLSYRISQPKRGDVIVFKAPSNPQVDYIKRIIGLPGETVKIANNTIYVNNKPVNEPYIPSDISTLVKNEPNMTLAVELKNDQYFVLGDNRQHSSDSREWGILPEENIIGKAWVSVYPWKDFGFVPKEQYSF